MAFAVITVIGENDQASTVNLDVHYLRPVKGGEIFCTAKVIRFGKRVITVSAEVSDDAENLVATALSTYFRVS